MRSGPAGYRLSEEPGDDKIVFHVHYGCIVLKESPIASICLKDELVFVQLCSSPV